MGRRGRKAGSARSCAYSGRMGRGQQTSMVRDAFSSIFGDRRGLNGKQARQQMKVDSPFSRMRDVAYRRMALLDWWLEQGVFATADSASGIRPYSHLDPQVAQALFEHDTEALMRLDIGSEISKSPLSPSRQFVIVPFSKWPEKCQEALDEWRSEGRPAPSTSHSTSLANLSPSSAEAGALRQKTGFLAGTASLPGGTRMSILQVTLVEKVSGRDARSV